MIRKAILWCIGLCSPLLLLGQGQTTNWYFGDEAGLRFNPDGSVTPLTDGRISTFEGCATISDQFGNLLFYTDGIVVYNREHKIMENGIGLYGDSSSTQSAIIVPKPEDPDIYYIFSVDTSSTTSGDDRGFHYSEIDLNLNAGLGKVVVKNIKLLDDSSEKIAAIIRNCFDRSIWVITMASQEGSSFFDTIFAWEITSSGVGIKPITTTFPNLFIEDPRGYLKLSPDGSILASANQTSGLYLFDFNVASGKTTGVTKIEIPEPNNSPYGIEFSPDGRFLYVHAANDALPPRTDQFSKLLQYDLNAVDIEATMVVLDERPIFRGALQLGENGKIYRTISKNYFEGTSFLGVINNPNEQGLAADYQHSAISLGPKNTNQGLPPFVQSFLGGNNLVKDDDGTATSYKNLCEGTPFTLEADSIPGAIYLWEKNGSPAPAITGFRHIVSNATSDDSGIYSVEVIPPDPTTCPILGTSTIEVIPSLDARLDLIQCDYDLSDSSDGLTLVNLEAINTDTEYEFEFFESIADRLADNPIAEPTSYFNTQAFTQMVYYRAVNSLGCVGEGEMELTVVPGDVQSAAGGPIYGCDEIETDAGLQSSFDLNFIAQSYAPLTVSFFSSIEDLAINQNELSGQLASGNTTLFVRKNSNGQCLGAEILELVVNPSPVLIMQESYPLCANTGELMLTAPSGFNEFNWYKIEGEESLLLSSEPTVSLVSTGDYQLEARIRYASNATEFSCSKRTSFKVTKSVIALISEVRIRDFSSNNTITVSTEGIGDYEYSLDGENFQDSSHFENVEPDLVTIYVRDKNGCGTAVREVTVLGYPKFFTPNGDGVNDFWQITGVNEEFEPDALIAIYDRFGSMVAQISPTSSGWSGKSNAFMYPASDYWFKVVLRSGREFKGHFALKR